MKKGDMIYTPRFCNVEIDEVYSSIEEAYRAGYKVPTYYKDPEYVIVGKTIDRWHMVFAAYRK